MNKKIVGILFSLVVVITACVASSGCLDWFAGEWRNSYSFSISLDTTEDLHNVTLYLPILMIRGEVTPMMFEINYPSNWTWNITDTEYGKMLKISTKVLSAGYHSVGVSKNPDRTINTEDLMGNEPILSPRYNETSYKDTGAESWRRCFRYSSYMYVDYNSLPNSEFSITLWMNGAKERGVLAGNQLEQYDDVIKQSFTGEKHGWYTVTGTLKI